MRDVLIEHLDGAAVPIIAASSATGQEACRRAQRLVTTKRLIDRKLLRTDGRSRPRHTFITREGRAALAATLADWAEALCRAGYSVDGLVNGCLTDLEEDSPTQPEESHAKTTP